MSAFTTGFWMWLGKEVDVPLSWILTIVFFFMAALIIRALIAISNSKRDQKLKKEGGAK